MTEKPTIRVFHLQPGVGAQELARLPEAPPARGFYWIACTRAAFGAELARLQAVLQALAGQQLVDLHVSDLLNAQLPSHYDYTAQYDLLVLRRLATAPGGATPLLTPPRGGPPVLRRIDTSPVGFAVFEPLLLSVHPEDCGVRDAYAARLLAPLTGTSAPATAAEAVVRELRSGPVAGARLPASPADLMLRVANQIVDNYLDLRRELSRQLDHWQAELLRPRTRFANWGALLDARLALHQLDEICEDQRTAVRAWLDALEGWAAPEGDAALRELDLLKVRGRDVLEHIERVVSHVRRLEHSTETAVQMHFSVQSHRTNDIMRTLTALTAVFLPLNLIAGIFGMNFEFIPLVHQQDGFWWAMGAMGGISAALVALFWRKRYLARTGRGS
ncbi:magnesium transporter CorA family protein [Alicycliphilus denitrificans]|uniref:magnesium transporter CorA family protein n=1 Tax=Alicycliphilus denitrificans TaxID=179636 RepID=UPI00384C2B70